MSLKSILFATFSAAMSVAIATGCAKKQDDGPVSLEGEWQSACKAGAYSAIAGQAPLGITQNSKVAIGAGTIEETSIISSLGCDGKDIQITTKAIYTAVASESEGQQLQMSALRYLVKPLSEYGIRVLNLAKWCGISDWQIDQEREVRATSAEKCFGGEARTAAYEIDKRVLRVRNVAPASSGLDSASTSPSTLEFNRL